MQKRNPVQERGRQGWVEVSFTVKQSKCTSIKLKPLGHPQASVSSQKNSCLQVCLSLPQDRHTQSLAGTAHGRHDLRAKIFQCLAVVVLSTFPVVGGLRNDTV